MVTFDKFTYVYSYDLTEEERNIKKNAYRLCIYMENVNKQEEARKRFRQQVKQTSTRPCKIIFIEVVN